MAALATTRAAHNKPFCCRFQALDSKSRWEGSENATRSSFTLRRANHPWVPERHRTIQNVGKGMMGISVSGANPDRGREETSNEASLSQPRVSM